MVVDTNVLVYAADNRSEFHADCLQQLDQCRQGPDPAFLTWGICYEFIRVVTHPNFSRRPWSTQNALNFVQTLLESANFTILSATHKHADVLSQTLNEYPQLRGSIIHDVHTAVLMREHGISQICTRDADFYRFPFLTVVDPLRR